MITSIATVSENVQILQAQKKEHLTTKTEKLICLRQSEM